MFKLLIITGRHYLPDSNVTGPRQSVPLDRSQSQQSVKPPVHVEQPVEVQPKLVDPRGTELTAFVDGFKTISKGKLNAALSQEQQEKLTALEDKVNGGKPLTDQDAADIKSIVGTLKAHLKHEKASEIQSTTKRFFGWSNKPMATLLTDRTKLQEDLKQSTNPAEKDLIQAKIDHINYAMTSKVMRKAATDPRYGGGEGYVTANKAELAEALKAALSRDKDGTVTASLLQSKATYGTVLKEILAKQPDDVRTQIGVARHPNLLDDTRRELAALDKPALKLALAGKQPEAVLWLGEERAGKRTLDQGLQGPELSEQDLIQRQNMMLLGMDVEDLSRDQGPAMLVKLGLDNGHKITGLTAQLDVADTPARLAKVKGDITRLTDQMVGNIDKRAKAYGDMGLSQNAADFLALQRDKVKAKDGPALELLQQRDAALLQSLHAEVTAGTLSEQELKLLVGVQEAVDTNVPELQKLTEAAKTKVATGLDQPVSLKPLDATIDLSTHRFDKNLGDASGVERTFFIKGTDGTILIAKKSSDDKMAAHERLGHVMGAWLGIPANKVQIGKFDVDGSQEPVSVHHLVGKNPQGFHRVAHECGLGRDELDFRHPNMMLDVQRYSPPQQGPSSWNQDDGGLRYARLQERVVNPEIFDQIQFFDRIVDNQDRHANNYLASDAGTNSKGEKMYEVSLIDHGRSFGWSQPLDVGERKEAFKEYLTSLSSEGNKTHLTNIHAQLERFAALTDDQLGRQFLDGVDQLMSDRQKTFVPEMLKAKRDAAKEWLQANQALLA